MNRLAKCGSIFDRIITWCAYLTGAIIVFVMLAVTIDITLRKAFNSPIDWVDEVSGYLLVCVAFLGAAWLLKKEGHVSVDVVVERLSPRARAFLAAMTSFLIAAVCLCVTYFGVITTWDVYKRGVYTVSVLEWPLAPLVVVIPFGSFLLFIQALRRAYGYLTAREGRKKITESRGQKRMNPQV